MLAAFKSLYKTITLFLTNTISKMGNFYGKMKLIYFNACGLFILKGNSQIYFTTTQLPKKIISLLSLISLWASTCSIHSMNYESVPEYNMDLGHTRRWISVKHWHHGHSKIADKSFFVQNFIHDWYARILFLSLEKCKYHL